MRNKDSISEKQRQYIQMRKKDSFNMRNHDCACNKKQIQFQLDVKLVSKVNKDISLEHKYIAASMRNKDIIDEKQRQNIVQSQLKASLLFLTSAIKNMAPRLNSSATNTEFPKF